MNGLSFLVSGHASTAKLFHLCTRCYHAGMKLQAESIQYTVRGIPPELDRALRRKAAKRNQSLNQVITEELSGAVLGSRKLADFSDLVGKWTPDPGFDETIASQRQIDKSKWS